MSLTPNNPRKRLQYVVKTYWDKNPREVAYTFKVAVYMFGMEGNVKTVNLVDDLVQNARTIALKGTGYEQALMATMSTIKLLTDPPKQMEQEFPQYQFAFPTHDPKDFILPWVARELVRLRKALRNEYEGTAQADMSDAVTTLIRRARAIAGWAKETGQDIMKLSLAEALEESAGWNPDAAASVGGLIYTFDNGWTAQELRDDAQLESEGEAMQHCVGGYCEQVRMLKSFIISIRDPKNRPHVTIEFHMPEYHVARSLTPGELTRLRRAMEADGVSALFGTEALRLGFVAQVFGKQNDAPAEKYRPLVWELLRERFDSDPMGMVLSFAPPEMYSFKGRTLVDYKFEGGMYPDKIFDGVDFGGVTMDSIAFHDTSMSNASFESAKLTRVTLDSVNLDGAVFDGARLQKVSFYGVSLNDVSFQRATLEYCDFTAKYSKNGLVSMDLDEANIDEDTLYNLRNSFGDKWLREHARWTYRDDRREFDRVVWDPIARDYVPESEATFGDDDDGWDDGDEEADDEFADAE